MIEQAEKLGIALKALKKIKNLQNFNAQEIAPILASNALLEISGYGKDSKNL